MNVTDNICELAILQLFKDGKVNRAGGQLSLRGLRNSWAEMGLRNVDFSRGIEALLRVGFLEMGHTYEGPALTLTELGAGYLKSRPASLKNVWERVRAEWTLRRARARLQGGMLPSRDRRNKARQPN